MITSIVTTVVVWTLIRIVQFVTRLWRIADAEIFPRVGVVSTGGGVSTARAGSAGGGGSAGAAGAAAAAAAPPANVR